jgi:hypothetical protein
MRRTNRYLKERKNREKADREHNANRTAGADLYPFPAEQMHAVGDVSAPRRFTRIVDVVSYAGWFFVACGAIAFVLGFLTAFWEKVPARIVGDVTVEASTGGWAGIGRPGAMSKRGGVFHVVAYDYRYAYEGAVYTGSVMCVCLPLAGTIDPTAPYAFVFPLKPSIAVLSPGPDFQLVLALLIFGAILVYLSKTMRQSVASRWLAHNNSLKADGADAPRL